MLSDIVELGSVVRDKNENEKDIFNLEKPVLGEAVVKCRNIRKVYKLPGVSEEVRALNGVSLDESSEFYPIKKGEFVMIRGPSGGGKTTLLNILGTLDSEFEGELFIMNKKITNQCTDEFLSDLRLKKIGIVFQSFNLISTMTAKENVSLPMIINDKLNNKQKEARAEALLKRVGLEDRMAYLYLKKFPKYFY